MSLLKQSSETIVTKILITIISIVQSVLLARLLLPEGRGEYALVILLMQYLVNFGSMGLRISNSYYVGKKDYSVSQIFSLNVWVGSALAFIVLTLYFLLSPFINDLFFKNVDTMLILLICTSVPFSIISGNMTGILIGLNEIKVINIFSIVGSVVNVLLLLIFLVILKLGVFGAVLVYVLQLLIVFALYSLHIIRKHNVILSGINFNLLKDSIRYGFKAQFSNFVQIVSYRFDMFLVAYYLGIVEVGYYAIAVSIAEMLWIIPGSVGLVVFSKLVTLKDEEKKQMLTSACKNVMLIVGVCILIFYLVSPYIIIVFFGKLYAPALKPLIWLLPGIFTFSVSKVIYGGVLSLGKPGKNLKASILGAASNIILNIYLIPIYGITGAAIASSLSYSMVSVIMILQLWKLGYIDLQHAFIPVKADFEIYKKLFKGMR